MSIAKAWAPAEIDCAIALYLIMRVLVERGESFNKRALIREQQGTDETPGPLLARSRGSVEMKLMNVTACLHDLGRHDLSMDAHGYRALNSYQAALKARVQVLIVDCANVEDIYWRAIKAAS